MHNLFWPDVSTVEAAKSASSYGLAAAAISAAVTAGLATWALLSRETVLGLVDAWAYLDAVLFAAVAFGIHKESRFAAMAGLVLYLGEKAYMVHAEGEFPNVLVVFFIVFYISGVRGTFALRRLRAQLAGPEGISVVEPRPDGSDRT